MCGNYLTVTASVKFIYQLSDVLFKFPHSVSWNEHVEPGLRVGLGDLEEPPPGILLQVHVVLLVVLVHDLRLQLPLPQVVRVNLAQAAVELNELGEVLVELASSGECHQNLVLS